MLSGRLNGYKATDDALIVRFGRPWTSYSNARSKRDGGRPGWRDTSWRDTMIKMIETVRHFEASERFVRGYDTMLDRAINIVGEVT